MWQNIKGQSWAESTNRCIFLGYLEDEFDYKFWDFLDKKVVRNRDIVFMENKTIEDWKHRKLVMSSQPTTIMESTLADPFSTQPANETEFEPEDKLTEEIESDPMAEERRYPRRQRKGSSQYPIGQYVLLTNDSVELEYHEESMIDVHKEKWYNAMQEEMDSLHENYAYELMELPEGKKALRNKWVYKLKIGEDGKYT